MTLASLAGRNRPTPPTQIKTVDGPAPRAGDARGKALRWWVVLTAGLLSIPFTGWLFRADASLSSMLHPLMAGAIMLSPLGVIARILSCHRG